MRRGNLKKILIRSSFILAGVAVFAVGSFSLAKYVHSEEEKGAAGVARMGVKVFELTSGSRSESIDYTQAVPGFDIPVPRISLHLDSEVGYSLYLKVMETSNSDNVAHDWTNPEFAMGNAIHGLDADGKQCDVVSYTMAPWWVFQASENVVENGKEYRVKYYKYNLAADPDHEGDASTEETDFMFKPATVYDYTGTDNTIGLLMSDAIIVSQHYGVLDEKPPQFYIGFEAYIQQTLG